MLVIQPVLPRWDCAMVTSSRLQTSAAGNASTSDDLGRCLMSVRPLCNGTLTTSTPSSLKLLEPACRTLECSMQISFSSELAHSMAVMLLELHAELEEFAYQHDQAADAADQLTSNLLGSASQA